MLSPRVRGAAHEAVIAKQARQQARPLSVAEVKGLEQLVAQSADEYVRIAGGFMLFLLSNAAKRSDGQSAEQVQLDMSGKRPVLEAGTRRRKTSNTAERRTTILPYMGFGRLLESNMGDQDLGLHTASA